jgi:hypothetical protein
MILQISDSYKYQAIIEDDDSGEKTTYEISDSKSKTVHEKDKYRIVKIIRIEDNHIIHQYKQLNYSASPFNKFVKIGDHEWWFGGREYMLKLFVNCDTSEVYDDPLKREESEEYLHGSEFIWTGPCKISPTGKYMLMDGCMWSFPYQTKLYDIRDLSKGYIEIDMGDHLVDQEKDDIYDEDNVSFKFVSDNEIEIIHHTGVKLADGKYEQLYYNTVKY